MWSWFLYVLQDILKEVVKVLLVVLEASFFAHTWKPFQGFYYREPFRLEKPFWPLSPTTSPSLSLLLPSASWKATTQPLSVDHVNQRKMHPLDLRGSGISTRTILLSISTTQPIMMLQLRRTSLQQPHFARGATASRFLDKDMWAGVRQRGEAAGVSYQWAGHPFPGENSCKGSTGLIPKLY